MPARRPLTWALVAASLVVGLAALVRVADPTSGATDDITGVIRLPSMVTWTIITLFGLAGGVMVVDLLRRMRSRRREGEDDLAVGREPARRQPWLQVLTQLLSLVNVLVVGYLLWTNVRPLADLMALGQGLGGTTVLPQERAADAPFLLTWTYAVLGLVGGGAALTLALWLTSSDRLARWWERPDETAAPPPFVAAVDESLEDLRGEADARRAIIRCYARFERAAAASGLARPPWHTPMEFMREVLSRLPAPRGAVRALTALFEVARFSDHALNPAERDRALDALDTIKSAIDGAR